MFFLLKMPSTERQPSISVVSNVVRVLCSSSHATPQTWSIGSIFVASTTPQQVHVIPSVDSPRSIWVLDGVVPDDYVEKFHWSTIQSAEAHFCAATGGTFNAIHSDDLAKRLIIISEQNGLRPLYFHARPCGSIAIASHLSIIQAAFEDLAVNTDAVLEQLTVSACIGDGTLLQGVNRILPRRIITTEDGRLISNEQYPSACSENLCQQSGDETDLWGTTKQSLLTSVNGTEAYVALSGGLDSRFLALAAQNSGITVEAVTLGKPGWLDVDLAHDFATKASIRHSIIPPDPVDSMGDYLITIGEIEHISDYLSPFWLNSYRRFLQDAKKPVINGFLGGPLSGGLVEHGAESSMREPLQVVKGFLRAINQCAVRWETLRMVATFDISNLQRRILEYVLKLSAESSEPRQYLEMRFRQFGFVALNTLNLYRKYCSCSTPFSDIRLVHFFKDLPPEQLRAQHLYRRTLLLHDNTSIPFASTTAQLYWPRTFTEGPLDYLFSSFQRIQPEMIEYIWGHKHKIQHLMAPEKLLIAMKGATKGIVRHHITFTEAILLFNAVVWLVHGGLSNTK